MPGQQCFLCSGLCLLPAVYSARPAQGWICACEFGRVCTELDGLAPAVPAGDGQHKWRAAASFQDAARWQAAWYPAAGSGWQLDSGPAAAGNLTVDQRSALSQDYRDQPSVTQGLRAWGSDAEKQQQHPVCDFEDPADACIVLAAIGNSVIFYVSVPAPGMGYFWNNVQTTDDSEIKR